MHRKKKIALVLGSGAARGWAHVGVIRALDEMKVEPDMVCGASIGALVGAAWLTDQLDDFQEWAHSLGVMDMLSYLNVSLSRGGLLATERAFDRFRNDKTDVPIESLPKPYAAVATDLATGREKWLREGSLLDAVRASSAVPGLISPVQIDNHWLVDGALVNPVPVSVARAMDADVVIAVNLNGGISYLSRLQQSAGHSGEENARRDSIPEGVQAKRKEHDRAFRARIASMVDGTARYLSTLLLSSKEPYPNMAECLMGSIDIMQDRITRARLAGEPADVLITPRLGSIGVIDFDRGEEMIERGYDATIAMRPAIELALETA
jgi:NTE family protein